MLSCWAKTLAFEDTSTVMGSYASFSLLAHYLHPGTSPDSQDGHVQEAQVSMDSSFRGNTSQDWL